MKFTLGKNDDGQWKMTAPVEAETNAESVNKLVGMLSQLRAKKLISIASREQLADYGFDEPKVTVRYTFLPPKVYKIKPPEKDDGENASSEASSQPTREAYQPLAETYELVVAQKDGHVYVNRNDGEHVVYEVNADVLKTLSAEFRKTDLFSFDVSQTPFVMFMDGNNVEGFRTTDSGWEYFPESDIAIDANQVVNYLLRIKGLRAVRYVEYGASDLAAYGLDKPRFTVTIKEGETIQNPLEISDRTTSEGERFAKFYDSTDVFVLPPDVLDQIRIDITEFVQAP